jgi:RES domain
MDYPGDHPEPHGDLADRSPLTFTIGEGTTICRLHNRSKAPLFLGKTGQNRFDSPDGTFGVLYAGIDEHCSFIETFGQSTGIRVVTRPALEERHLSYLKAKQPLLLLDRFGFRCGRGPNYQQRWQRGQGHHAAVRSLAFKWIRIVFRCWQDRVVYDESLYLAKLPSAAHPRRRLSTVQKL